MDRINTLLEKIQVLNQKEQVSLIDIDLMMDYTKVVYADLLEWRSKVAFTEGLGLEKSVEASRATESVQIEADEAARIPEIAGPSVELDPSSTEYKIPEVEEPKPMKTLSTPVAEGADIRTYIGINDKYQYISELFGNDRDAYELVISEIISFETEDEAVQWLKKTVAEQHRWSEQAEAAQSFYNVLSQYFSQR